MKHYNAKAIAYWQAEIDRHINNLRRYGITPEEIWAEIAAIEYAREQLNNLL